MKKKVIAALLVSVLTVSLASGCGSEYQQAYDDFQKQVDEQAAEMQKEIDKQVAESTSETAAPEPEETETEAPQDTASDEETKDESEAPKTGSYEVDGIDVTYYATVHNDKTGNWRLAVIYDGSDLNDYVADFYKKFVTDESNEVFGIVNLGLKTTTRVDRAMEDWLDISITEYQDGEEHDAAALYGGEQLKHYWINEKTGEVDNLED